MLILFILSSLGREWNIQKIIGFNGLMELGFQLSIEDILDLLLSFVSTVSPMEYSTFLLCQGFSPQIIAKNIVNVVKRR
jgi:hypothetical protein